MSASGEEVPLIASNEAAAPESKSQNVWKYAVVVAAVVGVSLLGVSMTGGVEQTSVPSSTKKLQLSKDTTSTIKYSSLSVTERKDLFKSFKEVYDRKYEDDDEEEERFKNFKKFLSVIDERNEKEEKAGGTAVHGITIFSDLTEDEFKSQFLGYVPSSSKKQSSRSDIMQSVSVKKYSGDLTSVDWSGVYTTSVNNQGYCGSCWAFSAVQQIESDSIRLGLLTADDADRLSVQQVVSCDTTSNGVSATMCNYGCSGGNTETAYEYIHSVGGVTLRDSYPYTSFWGSSGTCMTDLNQYKISIDTYYPISGEDAMIDHVLSTGPLSVCLAASSWTSYTSGIVSDCDLDIDHCVQVTGVNLDEGYWIVRNTWGTSWGINGYIYLKTGQNTCGITNDPTYTSPYLVSR